MALRITSKIDGFRRCGMAHPATPTVHESGKFTKEQVLWLKAERMLFVEEVPDEKTEDKDKAPKGKP